MPEHDPRLVIMLEPIEDSSSQLCNCGYGLAHWRLGDLEVCDRCLETLTIQIDDYKPNELCLN